MSKKVLLFDLTSAQAPKHGSKYGGMILYTSAVFIQLVRNLNKDIHLRALFIPENFTDPLILDICKKYKVDIVRVSESTIIETVIKIKPDLYFTPNPTKNRIVNSKDVQMLTVCHDIRTTEIYFDPLYWRMCEGWKDWLFLLDSLLFRGYIQKWNMRNIASRYIGHENIKFIAVSQHTRHHIMVHFPQYLHKKIRVFFSSMLELVEENLEESFAELPPVIQKNKFYLMDSGWRWSKNDLRAAIALDRMFDKHPELDYQVVITGVKKPTKFLKYLKHKEKFVLLNYVDRALLNSFHKLAFATIYPTLGEGFGYTPMESFKYGVPVIAACNSSVTEVCGDAVLYVNPYSYQEIENRCLQLFDPEIYEFLKEKSKLRYEIIFKKQKSHLVDLSEYVQKLTLENSSVKKGHDYTTE